MQSAADERAAARAAAAESRKAAIPGHILVVDDLEMNRDLLLRRLARQGHTTSFAVDGLDALRKLEASPVDLVLLDVMMPQLDGPGVLERMKAHEAWREIPVIMISAATDIEIIVKCISMGAADYLSKPFNPVLLRARIDVCLERKALRDRERAAYEALREREAELAQELAEAATYVRSVLPERLQGAIRTDWTFVPSTKLGGDGFGTVALDDDRLAFYLFDVSGHGVGAALLAASVMNVLNTVSLGDTDFGSPSAVLRALNDAYPMERHNQMYFTAWYGVYRRSTRELRYGSAGHPPAFLMGGGDVKELRTPGMVIGGMPELDFNEDTCTVPPNAVLHLYSDGAYEVRRADGTEMQIEDLESILRETRAVEGATQKVYDVVRAQRGQGLDDDFSLLTVEID